MNRRSFLTLLPALPFVASAVAKDSTRQIHSKSMVLPPELAEEVRRACAGLDFSTRKSRIAIVSGTAGYPLHVYEQTLIDDGAFDAV